jgi:hypothetical protein
MEVAERLVPAYQTPKSKHLFTQPQLLSCLRTILYEDRTLREAEICLKVCRDAIGSSGLLRSMCLTGCYWPISFEFPTNGILIRADFVI